MKNGKTSNKITMFQWIIIVLFAFALVKEFTTFTKPIVWLINNNQVLNWQYFYLYLPLLLNPIGLYGLYKITRFKKIGFKYFYISFASSTFLDFIRGTSFVAGIITVVGNFLLFLLFHFSTKKIWSSST